LQGTKELLAMDMERLGIVRVVSIREETPEQQTLPGWRCFSRRDGGASSVTASGGRYSPELEKALKELYQSGALSDPEERARLGV